ncbi:hypothetical protein FQN54_007733 [Arachnomyces sp. PD_36]|nr:hypothetical protein FQN54_007733 [Arachnomyces sp. PD_36]
MPPEESHSDDDDNISLTSTACSEQVEEYEVETILAQRTIDEIDIYLVKWEGYPNERSTWEPEDSFCDPRTLKEWEDKKRAISRGELPEFDVKSLEDRIYALEQASLQRKGRRRAKRFRLGLSSRPDDNKPEEADEIDSLFDSVDGDGPSGSRDENTRVRGTQKKAQQPTSHPKPTNSNRREDARNQKQSNTRRSPPSWPRRDPPPSEPYYRIPKRQLAKRTVPPVVGVSAGRPKDLVSRIQRRRERAYDPTDPARAKMFKNLSSQRRYEKAGRNEPAPDISQLDLRRPGEWLTSGSSSTAPARSGLWNHSRNDDSDSLFVEQDGPMPDRYSTINASPTMAPGERSPEGLRRQASWEDRNTSNRPYQGNSGWAQPLDPRRKSSLEFSHQGSGPPRAGERPSYGSGEVPNRTFGTKGRYWGEGEVLATLRFGPDGQEVGHVRLCNLDRSTRRQIVDTKEGHNIDLWFQHTCTREQYGLLCNTKGYKNQKFSNGWVAGFPDTTPEVNDLANHLLESNQAALWYHPQSMNAAVLVTYAAGSSDWEFFDSDARFPREATLKVVARSPLPPMSSLPPPLSPKQPVLPPNPPVLAPSQPIRLEEQQPDQPVMQLEDTIMQDAPEPTDDSKVRDIIAEARKGDIAKVFRKHFEFTYNELAEVNTFSKTDRHAHAFYLNFPDHVQAEFELMSLFLKKNGTVIYSNRVADDWEKFSRTVRVGTVLFHREFREYEQMRGLYDLLRKQISVFNISLSKPITCTSDRDHIERLFPHGGVVLLTEDFMRHDTDNAILITAWFREYNNRKQPGTWKMYLRPDIQRWLLKMDEEREDDKMLELWYNIRQLIPDYPVGHHNFDRSSEEPHSLDGDSDAEGTYHPLVSVSHMPGYGYRTEGDDPDIPKGLTQEERDADHLVECYAGWCWLNAPRFRRFIVLTWVKPQPRWRKWNHIKAMRTQDFIKEFRVRHPDEMKSASSASGPSNWKGQSILGSGSPEEPLRERQPGHRLPT